MFNLSSPFHKGTPRLEFDLSLEDWERLPRNAAYEYLYVYGRAVLQPTQWTARALLRLDPEREKTQSAAAQVRQLTDKDWSGLGSVFRSAFDKLPPFTGLAEQTSAKLAEDCLNSTRQGREGELLSSACVVAESQGELAGAALVTLLPGSRFSSSDGERVPHLTWVFVDSRRKRHGVGTALLSEVVSRLRASGYSHLASTFLIGNTESELWHWRMGFELLASNRGTPH